MESSYKPKNLKELILFGVLEFFGTFMILNAINHTNGKAEIVCATVFLVSVLICRITGAHYNPALSIAIYVIERRWRENLPVLITYLIA